MEGTHGELGARLTDGLGGDDADGLADVDEVAAGQIASVALLADAMTRFAGNRRAHPDLIHTRFFNPRDQHFIDHGARGHEHVVGARHQHILRGGAAEDPCAQTLDHVTPFDDGRDFQTR